MDIRSVWHRVFGEDVTQGKIIGPDQFRVICPFHRDRSPSCDVSVAKHVFICRACNASGGCLDVVVRAGLAHDRKEAGKILRGMGL